MLKKREKKLYFLNVWKIYRKNYSQVDAELHTDFEHHFKKVKTDKIKQFRSNFVLILGHLNVSWFTDC